MTDAHCHVSGGDPSVRELLVGRDFVGVHPWDTLTEAGLGREIDLADLEARLRGQLAADSRLGVGEIGLDRLKVREMPSVMRAVFACQLELAREFRRPVVLHGAKCWGQVVSALLCGGEGAATPLSGEQQHKRAAFSPQPPQAFLFHGFSRSDGLIPDIVALNGFISVGPAVLNDHAVNYRELVQKIPLDRLLVETDRTATNAAETPSVRDVLAKVAELRGIAVDELERVTDANAERFSPSSFAQVSEGA